MSSIDLAALAADLKPARDGRRAVVVGASLAGLLAARVLTEHFDEVLLLERDTLPEGCAHRRATPHTRHAHGLLASGRQVLEALFPGIVDEWQARGARRGDLQRDVAFYAGRIRLAQAESGVDAVAVGRALIEATVRRRVLASPRVRVATGVEVQGLRLGQDGRRVAGVRLAPAPGGVAIDAPAALVVDASGRASHLPQWLRAVGVGAPAETRVGVDIRYASAYFARDPADAPGLEVVICAATADCPRPGVMLGQEGGRWVVTLGGYGEDRPPLDRVGFAERAERAERMAPELAAVVRRGAFLCEPFGYRFPHSLRRHYERLRGLPDNLLAIGDSICSFNPIYGQGMSVAALEALALREELARGEQGLAARVLRHASRVVDIAWDTAVGADLAIPGVQGARPLALRLVNAYVARLFRAAAHDATVARAFLDVSHLLARPPSLMRPAIAWRVLRGGAATGAGCDADCTAALRPATGR